MITKRGQNHAQTKDIEKLCYRQGQIFCFKGTLSWEEYKTGSSILTAFELAFPGQIGTIGNFVTGRPIQDTKAVLYSIVQPYILYSSVTALRIHRKSRAVSVVLDQPTVLVLSLEPMHGTSLRRY